MERFNTLNPPYVDDQPALLLQSSALDVQDSLRSKVPLAQVSVEPEQQNLPRCYVDMHCHTSLLPISISRKTASAPT